MPPTYSWIQLSSAISLLSQRLNDPNNVRWTQPELVIYIQQALRMFNVLTFTWKVDYTFNNPSVWNSLGALAGSPRFRTLTDTYCYTQMEYMLLEPPSGGTWTGTSQFNIGNLSQALQTRRDEMIQVGNLNQKLLTNILHTPNTRRTFLPDTTIDVARVRYLAATALTAGTAASGASSIAVASTTYLAVGQMVTGNGLAYGTCVTSIGSGSIGIAPVSIGVVSGPLQFYTATTLYRDDTVASEFYQAPLYQQNPGVPSTFSLSSEPPLSFDVNAPPNQPGAYEAVVLQTGTAFSPPASTLLNIPDDFSWVLIYGALADLLGRESEATDRQRADYCLKRYQDGLTLLQKIPWIMLGRVNQRACNCDSIFATDRYSPNWDSSPGSFGPVIVTGGPDFLAAPVGSGVGMTLLGNAPVPVVNNDYVQISRSDFDIVLDLAQSLACFNMGGSEWQQALELEARAIQACSAENTRLRSFGAFSDILVQRGQQQEREQTRYNTARQKGKG